MSIPFFLSNLLRGFQGKQMKVYLGYNLFLKDTFYSAFQRKCSEGKTTPIPENTYAGTYRTPRIYKTIWQALWRCSLPWRRCPWSMSLPDSGIFQNCSINSTENSYSEGTGYFSFISKLFISIISLLAKEKGGLHLCHLGPLISPLQKKELRLDQGSHDQVGLLPTRV